MRLRVRILAVPSFFHDRETAQLREKREDDECIRFNYETTSEDEKGGSGEVSWKDRQANVEWMCSKTKQDEGSLQKRLNGSTPSFYICKVRWSEHMKLQLATNSEHQINMSNA